MVATTLGALMGDVITVNGKDIRFHITQSWGSKSIWMSYDNDEKVLLVFTNHT